MSYQQAVFLLIVVALGESLIIYSMYKRILELENRITEAIKKLKPEKPKKPDAPKKPNFWKLY